MILRGDKDLRPMVRFTITVQGYCDTPELECDIDRWDYVITRDDGAWGTQLAAGLIRLHGPIDSLGQLWFLKILRLIILRIGRGSG